jgi:peptide/nickel transport system permease protein
MTTFILRRFLQTIPVLFGVALISFILSEASGDPIRGMLGQSVDPDVKARIEEYYGYGPKFSRTDRFLRYMKGIASGNLGYSIVKHGVPVNTMIANAMKVTLKLALGAMVVATVFGVMSGLFSAWRPYSLIDYSSSAAAAVGISFPAFFLGMLLLLVFAVRFPIFPVGGYEEGRIQYLVLPCLTLGLITTASIARLTRNCMLETLSHDFIRTGRAKGLREWPVLLGHALPNALVPVVTIIGADFAALLSGAVLTETIFGLPGVGSVLYESVLRRDLPVVMACCMVLAAIFVFVNFIVDVSYAFLDPRIQHEAKA